MNNIILISTDLTTNFKPQFLKNFKKIQFFDKKRVQIFTKNFFLFLLILKYKNSVFSNSTIFIKPFKKKIYTILRSPYRHKLTRHQISLNRYEIRSSIKFKVSKKIIFKNFKSIINLFNNLKRYIN